MFDFWHAPYMLEQQESEYLVINLRTESKIVDKNEPTMQQDRYQPGVLHITRQTQTTRNVD